MEVHFYLPEKYWPDSARQKAWREGNLTTLEQSGKIATAQCWIYQTWAALDRNGFPANLTAELPASGIMVSLAGFFADAFRPPRDVFFAGIVADSVPHPGAQMHILQNPLHARRLRPSVYMPHWPQPNLLPRDPGRGDRFETLGFFGDESNLAPELRTPAWRARLEQFGVRLEVFGADRWHDYREVDGVVAVRRFEPGPQLHKPATKLYNAWLAGVPFIGGRDSAYAGDGTPGINYLQVTTPEDVLAEVRRLKENPGLVHALVEAGREAVGAFDESATLARWKALLGHDLPPMARHWRRRSALSRRAFFALQSTTVWLDRRLRR